MSNRLNLGVNADLYSGQPASSAYRGNPYLSVKKDNRDDKHEPAFPATNTSEDV